MLIVTHKKQVDLKEFAKKYGYKSLSLASAERLRTYLGVDPGAVSVLSLINDTHKAVEVYIDEDVWHAHAIACHPLRNDMTLVLAKNDVQRILKILKYKFQIIQIDTS